MLEQMGLQVTNKIRCDYFSRLLEACLAGSVICCYISVVFLTVLTMYVYRLVATCIEVLLLVRICT